jgi:prepilin-type N-terminal cleavage/methylation domain-containing protein
VNRAGFSLVEVLIAVLIVCVFAVQGVQHYTLASETANVDTACATLRSIRTAQRLYRLEHASFDPDLPDLSTLGLVEARLAAETDPFSFVVESADSATFVARADRHSQGTWTGSITIDQAGALHGSVESSGGEHVFPPLR